MEDFKEIREMLYKVMKECTRKGELSPGGVDILDKILNSVKNTYKIEMLMEKGNSYGSYEEGNSNRRGYSRDGGSYDSYGGGSYDSYGGGSYEENSMRRGYSRDGGREQLVKKMEEMLRYVDNEEQRKAVERCIHQIKQG